MEFIVKATAAGSAGSATGSADTEAPVRGYIEAIYFSYSASAANTTTITLVEDDKFSNNRPIATVGAGNTALVQYPRAAAVNTAGSAIAGSWAEIYISGQPLKLTLANANSGDAVTARIIVRDRTDVD